MNDMLLGNQKDVVNVFSFCGNSMFIASHGSGPPCIHSKQNSLLLPPAWAFAVFEGVLTLKFSLERFEPKILDLFF